jgi:hypothetical protein
MLSSIAICTLLVGSGDGLYGSSTHAPEITSVRAKGRRFGAEADKAGPIGGGQGYLDRPEGREHVVTDLDGLIRGWEPQGAPRSRADLEGARSLPTQHSHGLDLGLSLPVGEWTRPEERSRLNSRIPMSNAAL